MTTFMVPVDQFITQELDALVARTLKNSNDKDLTEHMLCTAICEDALHTWLDFNVSEEIGLHSRLVSAVSYERFRTYIAEETDIGLIFDTGSQNNIDDSVSMYIDCVWLFYMQADPYFLRNIRLMRMFAIYGYELRLEKRDMFIYLVKPNDRKMTPMSVRDKMLCDNDKSKIFRKSQRDPHYFFREVLHFPHQ